MLIYKFLGIIGLLLISFGIIQKNRKTQNIVYILGGVFLALYSLSLGDIIFITLQVIFTLTAIYDLWRTSKRLH